MSSPAWVCDAVTAWPRSWGAGLTHGSLSGRAIGRWGPAHAEPAAASGRNHFIANHAGDRFLIVDDVLLPVYEKFRDRVKFERVIVVPFGGGATPEGFLGYEELLAQANEDFTYPQLDENEAAAMCYTSGTTGRSKGVVYSHRAVVLHSMSCCGVDSFGLSMSDTILPVTSLFHANGWGIPFTAAMAGAKVVLPGPFADGPGLLDLMVQERVTITTGVPTVWFGVRKRWRNFPGDGNFPGRCEWSWAGRLPRKR